jgi:hypothetical protein
MRIEVAHAMTEYAMSSALPYAVYSALCWAMPRLMAFKKVGSVSAFPLDRFQTGRGRSGAPLIGSFQTWMWLAKILYAEQASGCSSSKSERARRPKLCAARGHFSASKRPWVTKLARPGGQVPWSMVMAIER